MKKPEHDPNGFGANEPGAKFDSEKPRTFLVLGGFSNALLEVSQVGTFGAEKYTDNGWRSVPNGVERYSNAMLRHLLAESKSETDDESGLRHAAHVAWCALARLELMITQPLPNL